FESPFLTSEPVISPTIEHVASPISAPRPNQRPSIPYLSRLQDQKLRDKANDQCQKFFQIFKDLNFNISFADALILMPKTPLNEHCSAVLLKKLPEKPRDPCKFLIPCNFPKKDKCLALADLGASVNLMPLSLWNKLSLPDLSPMCMTLELADHSISRPIRVAEDVYVKVGTFHFQFDFVIIDFDPDPRTSRYSANYNDMTAKRIDVIDMACKEYSQEVLGFSDIIASDNPTPYYDLIISTTSLTLTPFGNSDFLLEKVDAYLALEDDPTSPETSRYSANYNDMTAKRIDVIDMACKEYSQEVLGFSDIIASDNPTPYYDLIVSTTSLTLTPFGNSDFLLEKVDAYLALEDDPTSPEVNQSYLDSKGDILLLAAFLNDDPSLPPPNQGNYLPKVRKELKIREAKSDKSSIDESPEVELKDLPPHLEYVFLEGDDKLPVIIAKYLSMEEKTALITVLKLHKRAIAWKLSDIKGIDPEFCTHK
nr:reverse transcriptase domain-containing protein [Tanacetum cinerariifolium]